MKWNQKDIIKAFADLAVAAADAASDAADRSYCGGGVGKPEFQKIKDAIRQLGHIYNLNEGGDA